MKVAVLGMGRMGRGLSGRLLDGGHEVTVWNRTPGRADELLQRGARTAGSIAEAVADVDVAITSVADDEAVTALALGADGVRAALPDGVTYVDASTVAPATSEALAAAFSHFVAMPILGAPPQVSAGAATYLIGAEGDTADVLEPLFPGLSEKRLRYDRPAAAAAAKLTVNLLLLDGVIALAEAFATGRAGGLSDEQLRALLGDHPVVAPGIRNRFEGVLNGDQQPLWSPELGAKDARLAVQLADAAGVDLRLTAEARSLYERLAARSPQADIAAVTELYRRS